MSDSPPTTDEVDFDALLGGPPQGGTISVVDDSFHAPASDSPFWSETSWFAFSLPERRLCGAVYPLFRPNLGLCAAGVYIWDDTGEELHNILYGAAQWYLPMPSGDLTDLRLENGLRYERLEPLKRYRVSYADSEVTLDLEYDAMHPPEGFTAGGQGHYEQACRVIGSLVLHGETMSVDCVEMRDRSWSVRNDTGPLRGAFSYVITNAGDVLSVMAASDHENISLGWCLRNGEVRRIVGGRRSVERLDGKPVRVRVDAVDDRGEHVTAEGEYVNRFMFQSTPRFLASLSLVRWRFLGDEAWGEDQEGWSLDQLRSARRAGLVR